MNKADFGYDILAHLTKDIRSNIEFETYKQNIIVFNIPAFDLSFEITSKGFSPKECALQLINEMRKENIFKAELDALYKENGELISPKEIEQTEFSQGMAGMVDMVEKMRIANLTHEEKVAEIQERYGITVK